VNRRTGDITAARRLGRRVLIRGDAQLLLLPPLGAVVVAIALRDLALLVLCLSRNAPFLRRGLFLVEYRLLWERRLGRDEVEDHVWFEDWWMVASLCDE
jgi:hypothetical protein